MMESQDIKNLDVEMAIELVRLQNENEVLKIALELACEKISSWSMNMPKDKMKNYFIQQAKESTDEDRN